MNQKGIATSIVLVGILAAILAVGAFYLTQVSKPTQTTLTQKTTVSDSTANWKTYTGSSFSFKYPSEYMLMQSNNSVVPPYSSSLSDSIDLQKGYITIYISSAKNERNLSIDHALGMGPSLGYIDNFLSGKHLERFSVNNADAIMVKGLDMRLTDDGRNPGRTTSDIIIIRNNRVYEVVLFPEDTEASSTLTQILSTFKFTK